MLMVFSLSPSSILATLSTIAIFPFSAVPKIFLRCSSYGEDIPFMLGDPLCVLFQCCKSDIPSFFFVGCRSSVSVLSVFRPLSTETSRPEFDDWGKNLVLFTGMSSLNTANDLSSNGPFSSSYHFSVKCTFYVCCWRIAFGPAAENAIISHECLLYPESNVIYSDLRPKLSQGHLTQT